MTLSGGASAKTLEGKVLRVAPVVDLESGTVVVTVALEKGIKGIRLNRFATVAIVVERREAALTIPLDALAVRGREDRVLVCVAGPPPQPAAGKGPGGKGPPGKAGAPKGPPGKGASSPAPKHHVALRRIRTGVRQGGRIEVLEGLSKGEQVVVAAPDDLRSGVGVRVVRSDADAPKEAPKPAASATPTPTPSK